MPPISVFAYFELCDETLLCLNILRRWSDRFRDINWLLPVVFDVGWLYFCDHLVQLLVHVVGEQLPRVSLLSYVVLCRLQWLKLDRPTECLLGRVDPVYLYGRQVDWLVYTLDSGELRQN